MGNMHYDKPAHWNTQATKQSHTSNPQPQQRQPRKKANKKKHIHRVQHRTPEPRQKGTNALLTQPAVPPSPQHQPPTCDTTTAASPQQKGTPGHTKNPRLECKQQGAQVHRRHQQPCNQNSQPRHQTRKSATPPERKSSQQSSPNRSDPSQPIQPNNLPNNAQKPRKSTKTTHEEQANKQTNAKQNTTLIQYENMGPMCARNGQQMAKHAKRECVKTCTPNQHRQHRNKANNRCHTESNAAAN